MQKKSALKAATFLYEYSGKCWIVSVFIAYIPISKEAGEKWMVYPEAITISTISGQRGTAWV